MSHELVSLLGLGASVVHVAQMDGALNDAMARSGSPRLVTRAHQSLASLLEEGPAWELQHNSGRQGFGGR